MFIHRCHFWLFSVIQNGNQCDVTPKVVEAAVSAALEKCGRHIDSAITPCRLCHYNSATSTRLTAFLRRVFGKQDRLFHEKKLDRVPAFAQGSSFRRKAASITPSTHNRKGQSVEREPFSLLQTIHVNRSEHALILTSKLRRAAKRHQLEQFVSLLYMT
jgi:hypothetical protein